MRTTLLALAALTFAACGGPGSFSGTVTGQTLSVKSSLFLQTVDGNGKPNGEVLALADVAGGCDEVKANRLPKNGTVLLIELYEIDSNHAATQPVVGDYTVVDPTNLGTLTDTGSLATSTFNKYDTSCTNSIQSKNASSKSGVVKVSALSAVAGGKLSGSFDITFGDQADKTSGSFDADFCDAQLQNSPSCE